MSDTLVEAYKKLYDDHEPLEDAEEWVVASEILDRWNVSKLGEDMAKEILFRIINHTPFPSAALTQSVVSRAEEKIPELFPEIGEQDPSMDLVAELEKRYRTEKEKVREKLNLK